MDDLVKTTTMTFTLFLTHCIDLQLDLGSAIECWCSGNCFSGGVGFTKNQEFFLLPPLVLPLLLLSHIYRQMPPRRPKPIYTTHVASKRFDDIK